jgi:hypothetical protein
MDAAVFVPSGIPLAVFGPGGDGARFEKEWVDRDDVAQCAEI